MFSRPQNNCRDCSEWLSQAWKWLISKGLQTKRKPDWSNRRRTLRKMVYAANMLFDQMRCSLVTKTLLMLTHPKGHHPCSQTHHAAGLRQCVWNWESCQGRKESWRRICEDDKAQLKQSAAKLDLCHRFVFQHNSQTKQCSLWGTTPRRPKQILTNWG